MRVLVGTKVRPRPARTLRARRRRRGDARQLAAGRARGAGGRQPHLRARPPTPAARASTSTPTPARRSTGAWPPKPHSTNAAVAATAGQIVIYAGQARDHLLLRELRRHDRERRELVPRLRAGALAGGGGRPLRRGTSSAWRVTPQLRVGRRAADGLVKGSFRGIEVLKRGVSPRIVSAQVLGSRGRRTVSGPELAARLGLTSTWAYFSVRDGTTVTPEPDRSGRPAGGTSAPAPTPAPAPASAPVGGAGRRRAPPRPPRLRASPRPAASRPAECRPARAGLARSRPLEHPSRCGPTYSSLIDCRRSTGNAPSQLLGPPSHPLGLDLPRRPADVCRVRPGGSGWLARTRPHRSPGCAGRRTNFVTAELGGDGGSACGVLNAPLRAEHPCG